MPLAVGIVKVDAVVGAPNCRVHCEVPKKNSLFFTTGPPTVKPNKLFTWWGGDVSPLACCSAVTALRAEPLYCSQAEPWIVFVPDLKVRFETEPPPRPYSAA